MKNADRHRLSWPLLPLGLSMAVACGGEDPARDEGEGGVGGSESGNEAGSGGTGGNPNVPDAPTVQVFPSRGARGVKVDSPIVLTFSEPMSTASVEAAWSSASLPRERLSFDWNAEGTIVTIDASSVLEYPAGGVDVDRFDYDFTLQASASDVEGDELGADFTSSFATARDVSMTLDTVFNLTGAYGTSRLVPIRIGDTLDNGTHTGFITFDLSPLPADVVEFTEAWLFARQDSVSGDPYEALGSVVLEQISPPTELDAASVTTVARSVMGTFSDSAATGDPDGDRSANVAVELAFDFEAGSSTSTYRLRFTTAQDLDNSEDYAVFEDARLDVRLLAE